MLVVAWRNAMRRPVHAALSLLVVVVVTAVFLITTGGTAALKSGLETGSRRLGADILILPQDLRVTAEHMLFTGMPANIYMDEQVLDQARRTPGVAAATPQFFTQTLDESCCSLGGEYRLVGIDPGSDFVLRPWLPKAGDQPMRSDEVWLGADVPNVLGGQVGILGETFRVGGVLQQTGTGTDGTIFMSMETARRLAGTSTSLAKLWRSQRPDHLVSAILIQTNPTADVEQVLCELNQLPGAYAVAASAVIRQTRAHMDLLVLVARMFSAIVALLGIIALTSRYAGLAMERKQEIGLMRALGYYRWEIAAVIGSEVLITVLLGGAVGAGIGRLALYRSLDFLRTTTTFPLLWPSSGQVAGEVVLTLGLTVLLGLLAALTPALQAARIQPAQTLTEGQLR